MSEQKDRVPESGCWNRVLLAVLACVFLVGSARADEFADALKVPILREGEVRTQLDLFVLARIPELRVPETAEAWRAEAERLRARVLDEVIFRGVPREWYTPKPNVVWLDTVATGKGYSLRKLRFEALPGLWIPAVLYEPDRLSSRVPAVLNVNGHAATGKATPYKQLRCINLAKRGMLALNLEWLGMGQLATAGYAHNDLARLDLCGRSGVSVFYLAMARGLDVLLDHPHTDAERVAVTGLSGGGWQTIILSSLDPRVKLSVPVAGYSALRQRLGHRPSIGDLEQNPTDLVATADYVHLTAMLAPRPALLIYNAKDDCCFVADTVKENTYDPVVPLYARFGAADAFEFYVNHDPGTHNYDRDNRRQFYRFLHRHFLPGQPANNEDIPAEDEVQSAEALHVALPDRNATFTSLALDAARELPRRDSDATPAAARKRLETILRFQRLQGTATRQGDEARSAGRTLTRYRVRVGDEWVIPAIRIGGERADRTTLLLADVGVAASAAKIDQLVAEGHQVIAVDPVLVGQAKPEDGLARDAMVLGTVGQRPLGIQAAQILAAAEAFASLLSIDRLEVRTYGPRMGLAGLCAAAVAGGAPLGELHLEQMPESLKMFLEPGTSYDQTPEVYCFGLFERFDRADLEKLASQ